MQNNQVKSPTLYRTASNSSSTDLRHQDLIKDLKSELGGKFENVILGLMMPPFEYLAQQLYKAMDGVGTDEDVLFETLCTHSNAEIRAIRDAYMRSTGRGPPGGGG